MQNAAWDVSATGDSSEKPVPKKNSDTADKKKKNKKKKKSKSMSDMKGDKVESNTTKKKKKIKKGKSKSLCADEMKLVNFEVGLEEPITPNLIKPKDTSMSMKPPSTSTPTKEGGSVSSADRKKRPKKKALRAPLAAPL